MYILLALCIGDPTLALAVLETDWTKCGYNFFIIIILTLHHHDDINTRLGQWLWLEESDDADNVIIMM